MLIIFNILKYINYYKKFNLIIILIKLKYKYLLNELIFIWFILIKWKEIFKY